MRRKEGWKRNHLKNDDSKVQSMGPSTHLICKALKTKFSLKKSILFILDMPLAPLMIYQSERRQTSFSQRLMDKFRKKKMYFLCSDEKIYTEVFPFYFCMLLYSLDSTTYIYSCESWLSPRTIHQVHNVI